MIGLNPLVRAIVKPGKFSVTSKEGIRVDPIVGTSGKTTNNRPRSKDAPLMTWSQLSLYFNVLPCFPLEHWDIDTH